MYRISIHYKKKTERNSNELVVLFLCASEDWGTWVRTMKHRGINYTSIAERPMVEYEIEHGKKCSRLRWLNYHTWDALIEDEYAATEGLDSKWIEELITISKTKRTFDEIGEAVKKWQKRPEVKQQILFSE